MHVLYSTPAFDVLSFVHSIDLDAATSTASSSAGSTAESSAESEGAETESEAEADSNGQQGQEDAGDEQRRGVDAACDGSQLDGTVAQGDGVEEQRNRPTDCKMKEIHGDDWQAKEKEKEAATLASPDNQGPASGVTQEDKDAGKVVLKKGRRRRLVTRGAEDEVEVSAVEKRKETKAKVRMG